MRDLPSTMRQNSDGTVSIYTPSANKSREMELYTEVPFLSFHGMQTRGRDECDIVGTYMENLHDVWDEDVSVEALKGNLTAPLIVATIVTAALQFLVGYNVVVMNNPEKYVFPEHRTIYWSMAVAALAIGAPVGASIGGKYTAQRGRRRTLVLNILVFLTGGCIQTFAPSLPFITFARFIIGIASGITTVLVPIYLGELAPPNLRGSIGTVNQFAYVIGILVADLLSFRFANENDWRKLFAVTIIVNLAQLTLICFVVESPRWLLEKDPNDPKAKHILQQIRGYQQMEDLEKELFTYVQAAKAHGQDDESHSSLIAQMLSRSQDRYLFVCILLLHVLKQLCGVNAVFYYSTSIFDGVIDNPEFVTTLIGSVNVFFTYVALVLMDSCRRKSLLLWSFGGMFFSNIFLTLARTGIFPTIVSLVAVNAYVAFFEIGIGPIVWLIIAEMFEAKYVTVIMILCSQIGWVVNFMVSLVFPSLNRGLGDFAFVPFTFFLAIGFVFTWLALPETHGRTPAEVLVDVKYKASYTDQLSIRDLGNCAAGEDWREKVLT